MTNAISHLSIIYPREMSLTEVTTTKHHYENPIRKLNTLLPRLMNIKMVEDDLKTKLDRCSLNSPVLTCAEKPRSYFNFPEGCSSSQLELPSLSVVSQSTSMVSNSIKIQSPSFMNNASNIQEIYQFSPAILPAQNGQPTQVHGQNKYINVNNIIHEGFNDAIYRGTSVNKVYPENSSDPIISGIDVSIGRPTFSPSSNDNTLSGSNSDNNSMNGNHINLPAADKGDTIIPVTKKVTKKKTKRLTKRERALLQKEVEKRRIEEDLEHRRKYLCKVCSKGFTTSGHLARHNRIHTGEKSHACHFAGCTQKFSRHDNCLQHYRTHFKVRKTFY
ncbi:transcriptional regulator NRG1 NDAI_0A05650 [Naumovozyma dairenensis CBS 421]|uniref:C2H2-type domain-containing protein n=1 Tax=Naumovozyma dairenensis (strain ATCC 10597 / BCRC 20456 / CBS 421 / NBRC 0211 / NRRL Y-12639) TaxID=1071378 RepID=G0W4I2_NAUDC|nr:hypothetical protein NDAI_0A05650 [Naumovozyma dairenensis CBS 421]CCD22720.1 hypothetical protein NDAI_0A05650 [Naumovozyma dairenensis CBS 421]